MEVNDDAMQEIKKVPKGGWVEIYGFLSANHG